MKRIMMVLTLMCLPVIALAQVSGKLSGTVKSDGQPLVGANVIIEGTFVGAATDEKGVYYIHDVTPGIYVLRANYIGYQSKSVSNVRVNIGLTTVLNFDLQVSAIEGDAVEVVAEKALIEVTATNVARNIDSEAIENFAVRSVSSIISTQAGVVLQHDGMHIRGSRSEEIGYELEGASMRGASGKVISNAIPEALEAVSVQVGGYDASIGNANAGLIQQSLKTGGNRFSAMVLMEGDGMAESFGNTVSYGAKDITFTVDGPLMTDRVRFFLGVQQSGTDNHSPSFYFPTSIANGELLEDLIAGYTPSGDSISIVMPNKVTGNTSDVIRLNTTVQFDFNPLVLRLAATYNKSTTQSNRLPIYNMFNTRTLQSDNTNYLVNLKATYFLSSSTYIRANGRMANRKYENYDPSFDRDNLADWLSWGDREAVAKVDTNWSNNFGIGLDNVNLARYVEPSPYNVNGFKFARNGTRMTGYSKGEDGYIGFDFDFVTQIGAHEIKLGTEYLRNTYRAYSYTGINSLNSKIFQDSTLRVDVADETSRIEKEIVTARLASWIGYTPLGVETKVGTKSGNGYDAPRHPSQLSFYINDKFETGDLIVNLGLRIERIDQDNLDLKDYLNPPLDRNYTIVDPDGFKKVEPTTYFLPRVGLGFPITDKGMFHLNYGQYVQMAPMAYLYRSRGSGISSWGIKPPRETKFEIGYSQLIGDVASVDVTVFSRNPYDQISRDLYVPDATQNSFGLRDHTNYVNADFTNSTGIEIDFKTNRFNNIQLFANYVFLDARGTNSYPGSLQGTLGVQAQRPSMIMATRYAQRHRGNVVLDYRTGNTGNQIMRNFGANLIFQFNSGHPFTFSSGSLGQRDVDEGALLADSDPRNRVPEESINSSYTPWYFNTNLRLEKGLQFGKTSVKLYVTITNLFNRQHIINVYNRTGDAYDDGFLSDPELSSKIVEARGEEFVEMYRAINLSNRQHWIRDNGFDLFGTPRQIRTGLQVSF